MSKVAVAAALLVTLSVNAQKTDKESIEGTGNLVTREVPVSSFNALKASGVYELKLSQGDKETVKIEADENLQQYFTVRNEGPALVIDMKGFQNKNMKNTKRMRVWVTFKKLNSLDLSTVGSVDSEKALSFTDLQIKNASVGKVDLTLTANTLKFDNTSVGNVKLAGKAQTARFVNAGVGNLDAGNFVVQNLNIDNNGVGNATVNAEKELKVKDNMMSRVKNKGAAPLRKNNKVRI